jgi:prepilin-type N-terminal cleavage/methylation domain-containing protein
MVKIQNSKFKIQDSIKESSPTSLKTTIGVFRTIFNLQSLIKNNGFSFMELMVVIAIVALLVASSIPAFRSYTRNRNLKEGTNMVVSALRKTRSAAITERKRYKTALDTVNQAVGIYLVVDSDPNNDQLVEGWKGLSNFVKFDTTVDWSVTKNYGGGIYWVEFKPNGGTTENATISLLEESTEDTRNIVFYMITGRIKIEE